MVKNVANKKACKRVIARMTGQPWAIRPEMLNTLLAIAAREQSDPVQAAVQSDLYQAGGLEEPPPATVALIDITGPIFARADFFSDISGAASTDRITMALDDALTDPDIDSIVLRFDSPGGEVTGIHELANHIYASRDVKPLVAYVSGAACSAAYWLASATSYIFTDRTAAHGSIGVVAAWTDDSAAREKMGLADYEVVSSQSPNKRVALESNEGRAMLQKELDGLADIFISDVAKFRGTTTETVTADFGRGGTLLAEPAIAAGMADELSSLREVVALLTQGNDIAATQTGETNMAGFNRKQPSAKAKRRAEDDLPPEDIIPDDVDDHEEELPEDIEELAEDDKEDLAEGDEVEEPIEEERDPDAEDEDEEKETKAAHKAVNRFARTHKNLYRAILRRGARRERRRIESLEELAGPGRDNILKSAKFDRPRTVSSTMRSILRADKKRRDDMQADLREDANFSAKPAPLTGGTNSEKAAEKAVIDQIVLGAKNKLGATKK